MYLLSQQNRAFRLLLLNKLSRIFRLPSYHLLVGYICKELAIAKTALCLCEIFKSYFLIIFYLMKFICRTEYPRMILKG